MHVNVLTSMYTYIDEMICIYIYNIYRERETTKKTKKRVVLNTTRIIFPGNWDLPDGSSFL